MNYNYFTRYTLDFDHDQYNTLIDIAFDTALEAREPFVAWFFRSLVDNIRAYEYVEERDWETDNFDNGSEKPRDSDESFVSYLEDEITQAISDETDGSVIILSSDDEEDKENIPISQITRLPLSK
jgi:hypothetical protein